MVIFDHNIWGWRLGNQMFQIAALVGTAKKFKTIFSIPEGWKYEDFFKNKLPASRPVSNRFLFKENGFHYQDPPKPDKKGVYAMSGYFQSEKYFEHCKEEIRKYFALKDDIINPLKEKYKEILERDNICSIHVRRGDYVNLSDHHTNLDMGYYLKAIKNFPKDFTFVIFSDDIEWCKEQFPPSDKFVHIEGEEDYIDLFLMTLCKNNIIANSSFSWWSAWLNENPDKKVIGPKSSNWFGPANKHLNTKDLYPNNWIEI